jgi:outer membrane protein TolC
VDLFNGGRNFATLRQAKAEAAAADASLVQQQFAVTLTAKAAFFDVLRTGELVRVAQAQLQEAQQGLDAAQQRMSVGSATRSDVLRAQLALNQAKQAVAQAQTNESSAEFALGRLVGEPGPVGATAPASLVPRSLGVPEDQLPALVEAQAPTVLSATAAVKSSEAGVSSARAAYFPSLRLSGGTNWLNDQVALTGGNKSWNFGLGLSLPIFNGFQREQSVQTAGVQADNARAQLADARLNARATLESDLAALKLAEQQVALSQEAVGVAQEDLRVQNERYRLGAGTMLDRLTSEAALVQAQTNAVNARYDYQIARAQLEALVGRSL